MARMEEQVDVVVLGAGMHFSSLLYSYAASIGGVWSAEKVYPTLYAQIKHGLFEYSFYPMRHEGITEDGYISGDAIHTYLNDFASDCDLLRRTRLRTTVTNVSRSASGGWRLEIAEKSPIECAKLIYASGATSHPVVSVWPKTNFNSPIIHSSEIGTHLTSFDNIHTVTVVGGAKSAYDTVFLLLKAGKKVHWVIRKNGSGPLAIMPPTLLGLANTMDVVTTRIFWANAGLGAASVPLFWKTFHAGDCFDKSFHVFDEELQRYCGLVPSPAEQEKWTILHQAAEETVDELLPALKQSPFGSKEFSREETAGERKLLHGPNLHYRRLVVPALAAQGDRSVYFPGFIHSIYTPMVSEVQALWGVAFLLGLHDPPSQAEMEQEVAEWNVWTRKRYVAQGMKHAYAIFDFIPYIDTLLMDLGINPRRKRNPLANMFTPAYPREYKGLVDEFRSELARKQRTRTTESRNPTPEPQIKIEEPRVSGLAKAKATIAVNGYSTSVPLSKMTPPSALHPINAPPNFEAIATTTSPFK
ncbi:hypothetical protein DL766_008131 [Monosporascus sp. MC13-8B]|uniref:L-ornithine N(5)-oxygenase n=1 Tax=Monosporascus cannonballus TaxID=155416 RepID=A0ABY0H770_9PEZI|nr:hypothetical protein DL762_005053 [Monosporascus cannonballus]RYP01292.1 hypothetical protein DL763_000264 [Monosporascus cannonballus]RYP20676.1 hypothetical protein DL766_008131 [Monosporascus sp. MC13-8B]